VRAVPEGFADFCIRCRGFHGVTPIFDQPWKEVSPLNSTI
jgi:hypothetical protein